MRADFPTFFDNRNTDRSKLFTASFHTGIVGVDQVEQMQGAGKTCRASAHKEDIDFQDFPALVHNSNPIERQILLRCPHRPFESHITKDSCLTSESMRPENPRLSQNLCFDLLHSGDVFFPLPDHNATTGTSCHAAA